MRALLIDPLEQSVEEIKLPDFFAAIRREFGGAKLPRVATLPSGDRVHLVVTDDGDNGSFSLGGSGPHRGLGLILGPRGHFGMLMNSRSHIDGVAAILKFNPGHGDECSADRPREAYDRTKRRKY